MNLNAFNLNVDFLSSFDSELRSRFRRAVLQIAGSTQSTVLNRNVLRPNEPDQRIQKLLSNS